MFCLSSVLLLWYVIHLSVGKKGEIKEMIILRKKDKVFAQSQNQQQQPTSNDLMIEQMKLQKQAMETQKQREKLRSEEARKRMTMMQRLQKQEDEREDKERNDQIKAKKIEQDNNKPENQGLYKSKSKIVTPIPMRG